ncbi:MAG: hypothetical protein ACYC4U_03875 [Pirellulaceae bacterium]
MTNSEIPTSGAAVPAGESDGPSEHLRLFQPFVGQWMHMGTTQSDSPALGPKGSEFGAVMTYAWAVNKSALQIHWVAKAARKESVQFVELIGWDAAQMKLVSQGFSSLGAVEHNVWSGDGTTAVCDTKGLTAEGKQVTMRYLHIFAGDTMTFRLTEMVVDGKKQPDEEYKYRRVR